VPFGAAKIEEGKVCFFLSQRMRIDAQGVFIEVVPEPDAATMCASALFIVVLLRRAREQNGRAGETKTGTTSCWT
jgi:hypothetical protein